jgi:F-type H+-transporting ATPase subunit b
MSGNNIWVLADSGILVAGKPETHEGQDHTTQHEGDHKDEKFEPVKPDSTMFFLTWGIFLALLLVLYKVAWKPILSGLNDREDKIRKSLDDAEKASTELKEVQETTKKMLHEAGLEAKNIVSEARENATILEKELVENAKSEAQTTRDNALRDIEAAKLDAMQSLKVESAELAIGLAGKLLGENLDNEKNRALTEQLINKI